MKVALTGATGYTGGHLLRALIARGDQVTALAREGSLTDALRASGARWVSGDLRDEAALARLVEGAEAVLHVAAVYRTAGHPDSYYREINVGGTEKLLRASRAARVKRFVHTSTVGVYGHVARPPADESFPPSPSDIYQQTKAEADALVLAFGREHALEVSVVRPGAIYGPLETRLLKLFRQIARGRYAIVGSGEPFYHLVYIDDLVQGFLLAMERPQAVGEAFIIAGPSYLSQNDLAARVARVTGGSVLPFKLPAWPIQRIGDVVEAICVPLGLEPPIHRRRVDFWTKSRAFSIEKARRLLGYAPRVDVDEGLALTAASYRDAGWL